MGTDCARAEDNGLVPPCDSPAPAQPLALSEPQMNGLGATLLHQGAGLAPPRSVRVGDRKSGFCIVCSEDRFVPRGTVQGFMR